jgi:hypothetical protein
VVAVSLQSQEIRPPLTFLTPYQEDHLVLHVQVHVKVYILNLKMNSFLTLLCTWIHYKYTYT